MEFRHLGRRYSSTGSYRCVKCGHCVTLTGIAASALLNGVTVIDGTGISVSVTGVQATGATNQVLVWGRIIPDATVTWTEIVATP